MKEFSANEEKRLFTFAAIYYKKESIKIKKTPFSNSINSEDKRVELEKIFEIDDKGFIINLDENEKDIIRFLFRETNFVFENDFNDKFSDESILHIASEHGNINFLLFFYEWLAEKINSENSDKSPEVVFNLITEKFTHYMSFNTINNRNSVVYKACQFGHVQILETIKLLIPKENFLDILKELDEGENNVLHHACKNGDTKTINFILCLNENGDLNIDGSLNKNRDLPIDLYLENLNPALNYEEEVLEIVEKLTIYWDIDELKVIPFNLQKCFKMNLHCIYKIIFEKLKNIFEIHVVKNKPELKNCFENNSMYLLNELLQAIIDKTTLDDIDKNHFNKLTDNLFTYAEMFVLDYHEGKNRDNILVDFVVDLFKYTCPLTSAFSPEIQLVGEKFLSLGLNCKAIEPNLYNVLFACIKNDNMELIETINKNVKKENLNEKDEFKLVYNCAKYNSIKCFNLMFIATKHSKLLNFMLQVDPEDGLIPINIAIKNNNFEMTKAIICYAKKAGYVKRMLRKQNSENFAAEFASNKLIEIVLREKHLMYNKNFQGETLMKILCTKGNIDMLEKIFEIYPNKEINLSLAHSFFEAIKYHRNEIVEFLLRKHSNKEIWDSVFFKDHYILTTIRKTVETIHYKSEDKSNNNAKSVSAINQDENKSISIKLEDKSAKKIEQFQSFTEKEMKYNILDWAIMNNNEESAKLIVEYADLHELELILADVQKDENDEMLLTFWKLISKMPSIAEICLDRLLDITERKEEYNLDFTLLDKFSLLEKYPHLVKKLSSNNSLNVMVENDCENLLKHPFVKIYMNLKWNNFTRLIYYGGLALYLFYVIMLTVFLILLKENNDTSFPFAIITFILSLFLLFIEIYQFVKLFRKYFSLENLIQIISFISSAVSSPPFGILTNEQRLQAGCIAVLFGFFSLGLYSKRIKNVGIYSIALMQVTETIIKFLLTMALYLIGFSIAFHILNNGSNFDLKWAWIVKTGFMMAGDFSYSELDEGLLKDISYFVMVLLLIVLVIAINNMLTSFAIKDTNEILDQAFLQQIKTEVEFFLMLEFNWNFEFLRKLLKVSTTQIILNGEKEKKEWRKYFKKLFKSNELILKNAYQNRSIPKAAECKFCKKEI
ncbi:unnamed protein product [Brachionus calyciflorus]|uniref:Ion transport domain-containing protein n=1 Tax=Brachionus calyciflorus TaxID=104777 RepID=A0A814KJT6_9BILA|nr:unnamed protein product [Brachionus calyciflorus]